MPCVAIQPTSDRTTPAIIAAIDSPIHTRSGLAFPPVTAFPQLDATKVVERQYAFIRQLVDLNHEYARSLAEFVLEELTSPRHGLDEPRLP